MGISISTKGLSKGFLFLPGFFLVSLQAVAVGQVANPTNNLRFIFARDLVFQVSRDTSTRVYIEGFWLLKSDCYGIETP